MDVAKEKKRGENWGRAQQIGFSIDLVESAQRLRALLSAIDRQYRYLYDPHGPALSSGFEGFIRSPTNSN
jgi:hypothetical protein